MCEEVVWMSDACPDSWTSDNAPLCHIEPSPSLQVQPASSQLGDLASLTAVCPPLVSAAKPTADVSDVQSPRTEWTLLDSGHCSSDSAAVSSTQLLVPLLAAEAVDTAATAKVVLLRSTSRHCKRRSVRSSADIESQLPLETRLAVRNALMASSDDRASSGKADTSSTAAQNSMICDNSLRLSCFVCSRRFSRRHDLKQHIGLHLGIMQSVCHVCGLSFSHKSNLYRHMRTHTGERPYVCSVCKRRFNQANALHLHMSVHRETSLHCCHCTKKFRCKSELNRHVRIMHKSVKRISQFHCGVCGECFERKVRLNEHMAQCHTPSSDAHKCRLCRLVFPSAAEMALHSCVAAPCNSAVDQREGATADEAQQCRSLDSMVSSATADQNSSVCQPGNVSTEVAPCRGSGAGEPREPGTAVTSCCATQNFAGSKSSPTTVASHGDDNDISDISDKIAAEFSTDRRVNKSVMVDCNVDESRINTAADNISSVLDVNGNQIDKLANNKLASADDGVDRRIDAVIDSVLQMVSSQSSTVCAQRATTVADVSNIVCDICGRRFSRKQNMLQHRAIHDARLRRYSCPHCRRRFAWQQTRDRHVLTHTQRAEVSCPHCHQRLRKESLPGHIERIHLDRKRYCCTHCDKKFFQKSELTAHLRSHTQDKCYMCSSCGRHFKHRSHLARHEKQVHNSTTNRFDCRQSFDAVLSSSLSDLTPASDPLATACHVITDIT